MQERRETRAGLRAARRRAWWAALASIVLWAPVAFRVFEIFGGTSAPHRLLVFGPEIGRLVVVLGLIVGVALPQLGVLWRLARHPDPVGGGLAVGAGWLSILLVGFLLLAPVPPYGIPYAFWLVWVLVSDPSLTMVAIIGYVVAVIASQRVLIRDGSRLLRAAVEAREARGAEGAVMAPFACALLWGALWIGAEIAEDHRERQRTLTHERMRAAERAATHPAPPPLEQRWEVELLRHGLHGLNPRGLSGLNQQPAPILGPDGTIYVALDTALVAVAPSGEVKWRNTAIRSQHSSPVLATDGTIYVGGKDGSLYAARPEGTLAWAVPVAAPSAAWRALRRPALGDDGTIYVGGLVWNRDNVETLPLTAVSPDGTVRWQTEIGRGLADAIVTTPGGRVYVVGEGRNYDNNPDTLFGLDAKGVIRFRQEISPLKSGSAGPVAARNGTFYIARVGEIVAVRPPDSTLERIESEGGAVHAPLIGDDGTLFISKGTTIVARGSDGDERWTHNVVRLADEEYVGGFALVGGGRRLIVSTSYRVAVLGAEDGRELADYAPTIDGGNRPPNPRLYWPSPPAVAPDGTIYVVDAYYRLFALRMRQ